ncbi:M23 family metallopeptidase [Vulgatibacter incomptus]|uniref:Membrane protein related to metalloendopeptidase n=1 Tax=Vulgatibacter incomptus TaxID=1391653 RepID=A0A0K1PIR3_9BACT|nr:M23 family metallopeptidase [Vulgatibacter incomptus]AKU92999.1 Membrane protein related to metalloendopeptidase [Vulgatibacter incomptus]
MALLRDTPAAGADRQREAERAFDSLVIKQLLQASGAFAGKEGSPLFSDLIVDALADSLAEAGRPAHGPDRPLLDLLPQASSGRERTDPAALLHRAPAAEAFDPCALVHGPSAVTSAFGRRADPLGEGVQEHRGVDLGAKEGSAIVSAADGVVRRVGPRGGFGQAVEVDHGGGVTTLYAHASELLVAEGDRVRKGQPIARVGQTGRATGPHLHFEVRVHDRPVNPSTALKAYGKRAE